jgi:fructokinase
MGLVNLIYSLSPQRIILGGGVMQRQQLYPMIRRLIPRLLGGYLPVPSLTDELDSYLVAPSLGDDAGVLGALALAQGLGG